MPTAAVVMVSTTLILRAPPDIRTVLSNSRALAERIHYLIGVPFLSNYQLTDRDDINILRYKCTIY